MLLYEYPPKVDKRTAQLLEFSAVGERKKVRKNALKSIVIGLIIVLIGIFIDNIPVKILILFIGAYNLFAAYLLYKSASQINDNNNWTKIYDDHIEHSQSGVVVGKTFEMTFYYDDILRTTQNSMGELVFEFTNTDKVTYRIISKKGSDDLIVKDNKLSLYFLNSKPKLYLIENFYEKIKYPKKNYLPYEDDEDEESFL